MCVCVCTLHLSDIFSFYFARLSIIRRVIAFSISLRSFVNRELRNFSKLTRIFARYIYSIKNRVEEFWGYYKKITDGSIR